MNIVYCFKKHIFTAFGDFTGTEPEFVNLLRSPVIDSQPGGSKRQLTLTYRPARLHRLVKSIPWNRFLGIDSRAPYMFTNSGSGMYGAALNYNVFLQVLIST